MNKLIQNSVTNVYRINITYKLLYNTAFWNAYKLGTLDKSD